MQVSNSIEVNPISPPAPWLGGKRALSKQLVPIIDNIKHKTYAEPFVGMGGIFFKRTAKPKGEVVNDYNGEVINLFRILQRHYPQFMDTLKYQLTSRREFERLTNTTPETLTDLERAARFIYLQKTGFGGKVNGRTFGVQKDGTGRLNLNRLALVLEEVHERLAGVIFENLDWKEFIQRYDTPETLFYLDPPYWGNEDDYGKGMFDKKQFDEMGEIIARLSGKYILSINDRPEIRKIFDGQYIKPVQLKYTVGRAKPTAAKELFISNVNLAKALE